MAKRKLAKLFLLSFTFLPFQLVLAASPQGAEVAENYEGKGACRLVVKYSGLSRSMNVSDIRYLINQPGSVAIFKRMNPNFNSTWLKKLVETNKDGVQIPMQSPDGSAGCAAMRELKEMLQKRIQDKQWPNEDGTKLLSESLMPMKLPAYEPDSGSGSSSNSSGPATR